MATNNKQFWLGFYLGAGVTLLATIIPTTKPGIILVCVAAWILFAVPAHQMRWANKAPYWLGKPLRSVLLYGFITFCVVGIGWWRWPIRHITVNVLFKDSQLLTPDRKDQITKTLNEYYLYLQRVGFDAPKDVPPIGLMPGNMITGGSVMAAPIFTGSLYIPEGSVDDMETVRVAYTSFTFTRLFHESALLKDLSADHVNRAAFIYMCYYRSSFSAQDLCPWPDLPVHDWVQAIWEIRARFGKEYTDNLMFDSFRMWPLMPNKNGTFNQFFENKLHNGYSVRGNPKGDDYAIILEILKSKAINLDEKVPHND